MKRPPITILLLFIILFLNRCSKETIPLPSPAIAITSATLEGLTNYRVTVQIQAGQGQALKSAALVLEDITVPTDDAITIPIPLSGTGDQFDTLYVETHRLNHDFKAKAVLTTNKFIYTSDFTLLRSLKNTFRVYTSEIDIYEDPEVMWFINRGDRLIFFLEYLQSFVPQTSKITLNGSIPLNCDYHWDESWVGGDPTRITTLAVSHIPEQVTPGLYTLNVDFDGNESVSEKKIKVLEGSWSKADTTFPGNHYVDYAWFLLGDVLYVVGGHYYVTTTSDVPVYAFNMKTKQWSRKADFPTTGTIAYDNVLPFNLQTTSNGFVIYNHENTSTLWKYEPTNDTWSMLTTYPGISSSPFIALSVGNQLYMGAGYSADHNTIYHDFWRYDLEGGVWSQRNDTPVDPFNVINRSVVSNARIFVFEYTRKLWEYHPSTDSWDQKELFPGPRRTHTTLAGKGDDLYITGGQYYQYPFQELNDCWRYSTKTGQWEMVAWLPIDLNYGFAFTYQQDLYAGMGFLTQWYGPSQPFIYQFNPQ